MKESKQGGSAKRRPPCLEAALRAASFMDGCVAVAVAEAETVAVAVAAAEAETVAVAVAEINPSPINPPGICDRFGFLFSKNIVCSKNITRKPNPYKTVLRWLKMKKRFYEKIKDRSLKNQTKSSLWDESFIKRYSVWHHFP